MIYYLQSQRTGLIKIGFTNSATQRLNALAYRYGKCDLLAVHCGSKGDERSLHAQFDKLRAYGEWFHPELRLRDHINSILTTPPVLRRPLPSTYILQGHALTSA